MKQKKDIIINNESSEVVSLPNGSMLIETTEGMNHPSQQ